jgi:hypothetical protein
MADELNPGDPGTIEANPPADDSEAGKAGMPDDPNMPKDSPLKSEALDGDDEYTKQLKEMHRQNVDRADRYAAQQQALIDHFQKQQSSQPQTPQLQQMPPMSQEAKGTAAQTVFNVLAVAATAFAVFGSRRNPYSQGAMMSGLGALFSGIAQGRQDKVKQDSVKWHQLNESVQSENKARLQNYKDILSNKRLDLQQQMDLIKMNAQFHKDLRLEGEASEKNLAKIQKNLEDKQRQLKDHAGKTTKGTVPHNSVMLEDYRQRVLEKSGGKVDFNTDPDGAREVYPWSQYLKDSHRDEGKKKPKEDVPDKSSESDDPLDIGLVKPKKMDTKTDESVLDSKGTGGGW